MMAALQKVIACHMKKIAESLVADSGKKIFHCFYWVKCRIDLKPLKRYIVNIQLYQLV